MSEVEIVLMPDGSLMIPRGDKSQNSMLMKLLESMTDVEDLSGFFSVSEHSEELIGNARLCG